jgi:hypothetical protein
VSNPFSTDILAIESGYSIILLNFYKIFKLGVQVSKLRFYFAESHVSPHSKVVTFAINFVAMVRGTGMIRIKAPVYYNAILLLYGQYVTQRAIIHLVL